MNTKTETVPLIGYYSNRGSKDGVDIEVTDFFRSVRESEDFRKFTEWVRAAPDQDLPVQKDAAGKKIPREYDTRKDKAPCVTIGGIFNDGGKSEANLREASGLLATDLDDLNEDVDRMRNRLRADPYVYAVFKSIGGRGLCVIFRINSDRWEDSFNGIREYLIAEYGLVGKQFDPSSSNINRLRYISFDPEIFVNLKAAIFRKYPRKEAKPAKPVKYLHTSTDIRYVIDQIHARALDITSGYEAWYRIGWALIAEYGEAARPMFHEISQYNAGYDSNECDKKFKYLTGTRPLKITISTFYYYCKLAGLDLITQRSKEIGSVVAMAKKQRASKADALATVKDMIGADAEEATPIIEQIYESAEPFETDETLFDQLELFIRSNYSLRYNEVTHYIENGGVPLQERQLNELYIEAAKFFNMKISKDNVFSFLLSEKIPAYHPIKDFFHANKDRRPDGVIDALAATIRHDMGGLNYVPFFLRKFLVGMVSTVYGLQCPLVPVLTGVKNSGKTQFWRRLLPEELKKGYYAETNFRKEADDEILMCKSLLIMNDEFDNDLLNKHGKFKSLTDKHTFTIRKPYGKSHEKIPRLAVIAGTSNERDLLSDPTGNRRIIPINVLGIDHEAYNAIDKTALIMEAYHAYMDGERCDLNNEQINFLERHTGSFVDITIERDMVDKYFDVPTEKGGVAECWSQGEILVYLQNMTGLKSLRKKIVSMEMKSLGFPYSDGDYYAPEKKAKRGFYLYRKVQGGGEAPAPAPF